MEKRNNPEGSGAEIRRKKKRSKARKNSKRATGEWKTKQIILRLGKKRSTWKTWNEGREARQNRNSAKPGRAKGNP